MAARPTLSFDHLVGAAEQRERDDEAEGFRGLEVDDQLDFRRLLDRQVGWLLALENPADICACRMIGVGKVAAVAHQAASRRELASLEDRGHSMAGRQGSKLLAPADEELIGADHEPAGLQLDQSGEDGVEVAFGACMQNMKLP